MFSFRFVKNLVQTRCRITYENVSESKKRQGLFCCSLRDMYLCRGIVSSHRSVIAVRQDFCTNVQSSIIYQLIMAIFFKFNTPRPRQFHYRPLYYDERRERLEKMKARAEAELAAERNRAGYPGLQKGFLAERRVHSKMHKIPLEKKSALRFLIILIALLGLLYWFMPEIFHDFWMNKRH